MLEGINLRDHIRRQDKKENDDKGCDRQNRKSEMKVDTTCFPKKNERWTKIILCNDDGEGIED